MHIILDSTAYRADPLLKGNAFRIFLSALDRIGANLLIPQVVLEEVVNAFREQLNKFSRDLQTLSDSAKRILREPVAFQSLLPELEAEVSEYRARLLRTLGGAILPIPTIAHGDLLQRALQRRKPFNEQGAGYRDALIWANVLDTLLESSGQVYFVSANRRDFFDNDQLHPDLAKDLKMLDIKPDRLRCHEQLDALNAELVLPNLEHLDTVFEQINSEQWGAFSLKQWVLANLATTIRDEDLVDSISSLSDEGVSIMSPKVTTVNKLVIDDVRSLASGIVLLSATAEVNMSIGLMIGWDAYVLNSNVRRFVGESEDPFVSLLTDEFVNIRASFSLVIDANNQQVASAQLDSIHTESESIELHAHPSKKART